MGEDSATPPIRGFMPTLVRLFVVLLLLAGLVVAGMVALTMFVDPGEKEITVRIPARDLAPRTGPGASDLLTPRTQAPQVPVTPPAITSPEAQDLPE